MAAFVRLGVRRIRLTGGEPPVRRDLPQLVRRPAAPPGLEDLSPSTGGARPPDLAGMLRASRLQRVDGRLDSLDAGRVRTIAGGGRPDEVLAGLAAAQAEGLDSCLGQERAVPLAPLLRAAAEDATIEAAIREVVRLEPERHEFQERPQQIARFMSATGG